MRGQTFSHYSSFWVHGLEYRPDVDQGGIGASNRHRVVPALPAGHRLTEEAMSRWLAHPKNPKLPNSFLFQD